MTTYEGRTDRRGLCRDPHAQRTGGRGDPGQGNVGHSSVSLSPNDEWADFEIMPYKVATNILSEPNGSYIRQAYLRGLELEDQGIAEPLQIWSDRFERHPRGRGVLRRRRLLVEGRHPRRDRPAARLDPGRVAVPNRSGRHQKRRIRHCEPKTVRAGPTATPTTTRGARRVLPACGPRRTLATRFSRPCAGKRRSPRPAPASSSASSEVRSRKPTWATQPSWRRRTRMPSRWGAICRVARAPRRRLRHGPCVTRWRHHSNASRSSKAGQKTASRASRSTTSPALAVRASTPQPTAAPTTARAWTSRPAKPAVTAPASSRPLWTDPDWDATERAFYYVRVLENPTCRWSTWDAIRHDVEPRRDMPATIQERAWSSPIWYSPAG